MTNTVNVDVWLSPTNADSYYNMLNLKEIMLALHGYLNINARYLGYSSVGLDPGSI